MTLCCGLARGRTRLGTRPYAAWYARDNNTSQNQMERDISKKYVSKIRTTSRGCPFFRKFGNSGNFLYHLAFHLGQALGVSPAVRLIVEGKPWPIDGEVYQCSVCFLTSDDLPFFLRYLCCCHSPRRFLVSYPGFPTGMWPVWITAWQRSSHVSLVIRK